MIIKKLIGSVRGTASKYGSRWILGLMLLLSALSEVDGDTSINLIRRLDLAVYDFRMRLLPAVNDPRIIIVNIDEKSLSEVGRWPWSRDVVAELVTQLTTHYQAKVVAFDVIFAEPDTSSGYATLEAMANKELKDIEAFGDRLKLLKPTLDYDARLANALLGRPVVLGYYLSNDANAFPKGMLPEPAFTSADLDKRDLTAISWKAYTGNLPELQKASKAGGFFNPIVEPDGVIRRVPLLSKVGPNYYESLALATARLAMGATAIRPVFPPADIFLSEQDRLQYGALDALSFVLANRTMEIPVERKLTSLIQYRGHGGETGGAFRYVSAADILKGRISKDLIKDTIILVGTTVPGLNDLRVTPVNENYPGVEIHANMIASILDNSFKQRPDFSLAIELMQVCLFGVVLIFLLPILTPSTSMMFALGSAALLVAFNFWAYQSLNWVLPIATVLLLVFGLMMLNLVWGYLFEFRKGRAIVNLFGEYVAPELVAEMALNPESYHMEGESRELTVLFSDVRGFTTISEGLEPNVLREYINTYLTAMSEDIRGNRGTLDKYIGDAVMAFWGAPVTLPDHASRAVATALQMQASAKSLNESFVARGWPPLKIGIGINTGQMRVGDMGSKVRRAYTVMGDAVNLSSRLEGITKVYGVGVVVGEATKFAATAFAYRELDRVRVKGKNEPVPIFEPIGLNAELDENYRKEIHQWHTALNYVRMQQWDQAQQLIEELLSASPGNALYDLYLQRIQYYREQPPGADWDGVTTFDVK